MSADLVEGEPRLVGDSTRPLELAAAERALLRRMLVKGGSSGNSRALEVIRDLRLRKVRLSSLSRFELERYINYLLPEGLVLGEANEEMVGAAEDSGRGQIRGAVGIWSSDWWAAQQELLL